jgi:hypothetical protein
LLSCRGRPTSTWPDDAISQPFHRQKESASIMIVPHRRASDPLREPNIQ